jgi:hypothetical protein
MEPNSTGLPAPVDEDQGPRQPDFFPASEFIELEKQRIQSFDRRTEVARAAVEADRESEKDLFAYHMKRLENVDGQHKREHRFASRFIWACLGVSLIFAVFLVAMAFFGLPGQQAMAIVILNALLKLASGAGLFVLVRQVWRRLFKRPADE